MIANNFNVVGDLEGRIKTLKALLDKMPKDAELLSLGDVNDRGPSTKELIEFLMKNGETVQSNHGHMMVEAWKHSAMPGCYPLYYALDIWPEHNGGMDTLRSYAPPDWLGTTTKFHEYIPESHIKFLENCPPYIESDDYIMSHAPIRGNASADEACDLGLGFNGPFNWAAETSIIWNRYVPEMPNAKLNGKINIFGHNSSNAVKVFTTEFRGGIKVDQDKFTEIWSKREKYPIFAIGLDTSGGKFLTGLHLPTLTLYHQEFID